MHIILNLAFGFVCLVSAWYLLLVGGSVNSTTADRGHQSDLPGPVSVNHGIKKIIWNGHGYRQSHWVRLTVTVCILFCVQWESA